MVVGLVGGEGRGDLPGWVQDCLGGRGEGGGCKFVVVVWEGRLDSKNLRRAK